MKKMQPVVKTIYFKVFLYCHRFVCVLANMYIKTEVWRPLATSQKCVAEHMIWPSILLINDKSGLIEFFHIITLTYK